MILLPIYNLLIHTLYENPSACNSAFSIHQFTFPRLSPEWTRLAVERAANPAPYSRNRKTPGFSLGILRQGNVPQFLQSPFSILHSLSCSLLSRTREA